MLNNDTVCWFLDLLGMKVRANRATAENLLSRSGAESALGLRKGMKEDEDLRYDLFLVMVEGQQ